MSNTDRALSDEQPAPDPMRLPEAIDKPPNEAVIIFSRTTFYYLIFASAFLFLIALFIGWTIGSTSANGASASSVVAAVQTTIPQSLATSIAQAAVSQRTVAQQPPTQDPNQRFAVEVDGEPFIGPKDARVTVVEFSDFQCPFCERFFAQTEQTLLKEYEGKIRFVYRDFPLDSIHPYARGAAEAAQCAYEQGKFWEYHDLLFQNQQRLTKDDLLTYARQLKLDEKAFQTCVDSGKYANAVDKDFQDGVALGLTGTPTFFVNGRMLIGAQPLSAFVAYIDQDLASAENAPAIPTLSH